MTPDRVFQEAEYLIGRLRAMQDELMMSTMVGHSTVQEIQGHPQKSTAQGRREAAWKNEAKPRHREARYAIGWRPEGEDPRSWYLDSYAEENEAREAAAQDHANDKAGVWTVNPETDRVDDGSVNVLNVNNGGTVGIQSANEIHDRNIEL